MAFVVGYVGDLMKEVFSLCRKAPAERVAVDDAPEAPPTLCADFQKPPSKLEAIQEHCSRFENRD